MRNLHWLDNNKIWIAFVFLVAIAFHQVLGQEKDQYAGGGGYDYGDYGGGDYGAGYYQVYNGGSEDDNYKYESQDGQIGDEDNYILCYTCHYHVKDGNPEGMPQCDEPFDESGVPTVKCYNDAPCGQYDRKAVADPGPQTIMCYSCHYHIQSGYPEGMPSCDDPFDEGNIPVVDCPGPCGKLRQRMTDGNPDDYLVTRNCIPKCKERRNDDMGNYQECCSTPLCNGANGSQTKMSSLTFIVSSIVILFLLVR